MDRTGPGYLKRGIKKKTGMAEMSKLPTTKINIEQMRKSLMLNSYRVEMGSADLAKNEQIRKTYETILYSYQLEMDYKLARNEIDPIEFFESDGD